MLNCFVLTRTSRKQNQTLQITSTDIRLHITQVLLASLQKSSRNKQVWLIVFSFAIVILSINGQAKTVCNITSLKASAFKLGFLSQ